MPRLSQIAQAMPSVYRTLYFFLLCADCFAKYYSFNVWTPEKGGEPSPGDGIPFFFELVLSILIILPLCLALWSRGFRHVRLRKTALGLGLFILGWPVLLLIGAGAYRFFSRL